MRTHRRWALVCAVSYFGVTKSVQAREKEEIFESVSGCPKACPGYLCGIGLGIGIDIGKGKIAQ